MNNDFPLCEICGIELINGLDMSVGICGKCWFDSKESYDGDEEY